MPLLFKEAIYLISFLAWPLALLLLWALYKIIRQRHAVMSLITAIILAGTTVFIWARFVEPRLITVRYSDQTKVGINKRVALFADTHLGIYNDGSILQKTVDVVNGQSVDAVLIAGDFTYHPNNMRQELAPLKELRVPVFAILGNHDVERPGPPIRTELESVLQEYGVRLINNESVEFGDGLLVGLGDNFAGEDDVEYLDELSKTTQKPLVILTHNPDTVLRYPADLYVRGGWTTLTGHTHCGQIRLPFLYKNAIRGVVDGEWYEGGYYNLSGGTDAHRDNNLYITCGIGEVVLPLRLNNPPVVDIIEL